MPTNTCNIPFFSVRKYCASLTRINGKQLFIGLDLVAKR